MKKTIVLLISLLSLGAFAKDVQLGNVVAVERSIDNIYDKCLSSMDKPGAGSEYFFSCAFRYIKTGETPITNGRAFNYTEGNCRVNAETVNGNVFITFSTDRNTSGFEESRACLAKSVAGNKTIKVIVYTIL